MATSVWRYIAPLLLLTGVHALAQPATPDTARIDAPPGAGASDGATETPDNPLLFSGSARIYGQTANRQGTYQATPADFARLELAPTLSLYGVPFTLNVFLSTEQSSVRQNINSVSLDLDYQKLEGTLLGRAYDKIGELEELKSLSDAMGGVEHLRDSLTGVASSSLRDLESLKDLDDIEKIKDRALSESLDKLDELGLVGSSEKFFANFPALSVGVTYPSYTALTLSGAPVTGVNVEWNPGNFYVAFAGGKTQRAIQIPGTLNLDSVVFNPSYSRMLYSARIGYGKKEGSHVILTALYSKDDQGSLPIDSTSAPITTPKANYVLSLDVNVPVVQDRFTLMGEIAGSMLTGDVTTAEITSSDIPDWVKNLVAPNVSSVADYAYLLRSVVNIPETGTRLTGSLRSVGPVYFSLGVPALRNDNLRWEGRLEQKFARRQVTASVFYKHDADNLFAQYKDASSTVTSFGVGLGLNFVRLPYLRVEYSPYQQRYTYATEALTIENRTTLITANTGYYYKIGSLNAGTSLGYSSQQANTFQGLSDYGVSTITANQNVNFTFPLAISAGFSSSTLKAADSSQQIISLDLSGSYTAFDIWNTSAGFTLARQADADNNAGFYINSSVALWNAGIFELRAERNVYRNLLYTLDNFNEFIFSASFTSRW
jgi:hypothetical protein